MGIFQLLSILYAAAALIPITIYLSTRRTQNRAMIYLAIMLVASFFVDAFGTINILWLHIGKISNTIGSVYGYLEFVVVTWLYQTQLNPKRKLPFLLIIATLGIIQTTEMLAFRGIAEFLSTSRAIFSIVVTILALWYFLKLMLYVPTTRIYHIPMFWINIGMMMYFTGNFFLFVVRDYLIEVLNDSLVLYWSFHNFLGIIAYIFMSIGLWQARRPTQQKAIPT